MAIGARFVVRGDGLRSRIARAVGAPVTDQCHENGACHYTYLAGLDFSGTEFHLAEGRFVGLFPTHCGEANAWVSTPVARAERLRGGSDRNRAFREVIAELSPHSAERLAAARQTAPIRGFSGMPNMLRQPAGAGWARVGDASYFRGAITGHGVTDTFRNAEYLARTLGATLAGDADERSAHISSNGARWSRTSSTPPARSPWTRRRSASPALQKQLSRCIEAEAATLAPPADARAAPAPRPPASDLAASSSAMRRPGVHSAPPSMACPARWRPPKEPLSNRESLLIGRSVTALEEQARRRRPAAGDVGCRAVPGRRTDQPAFPEMSQHPAVAVPDDRPPPWCGHATAREP